MSTKYYGKLKNRPFCPRVGKPDVVYIKGVFGRFGVLLLKM
jgi:hypothetical protein